MNELELINEENEKIIYHYLLINPKKEQFEKTQQESLLDTVQPKSGTSQEAKAINLQQVKTQDGMNEYFDQNQPQQPQLETTDVEIAPVILQM